jgi:hypothetical protein
MKWIELTPATRTTDFGLTSIAPTTFRTRRASVDAHRSRVGRLEWSRTALTHGARSCAPRDTDGRLSRTPRPRNSG